MSGLYVNEKEYVKYCHPAYLTYMRNTGLEEAQAGIKIASRNINNKPHRLEILKN